MSDQDFSKRVQGLITELSSLQKEVDANPDLLGSISFEDYFIFTALVKEYNFFA